MNRRRQLATADGETPNSAATCVWNAPGCAQASTIRHRNAYACVEVAARALRSNSPRSAAVTENGAFGLRDIAARLVIATGAWKGHAPQPATWSSDRDSCRQ